MRSELIALLWSKIEFYTKGKVLVSRWATYICEPDREMQWINRGHADSHAYLCTQSREPNKPIVILTCLMYYSLADLMTVLWTFYLSRGSSAPSQILSQTRPACYTLLFWVSYAWHSLFSYFYVTPSYSSQSEHLSAPTSAYGGLVSADLWCLGWSRPRRKSLAIFTMAFYSYSYYWIDQAPAYSPER